uniref:Secreted protein n=1 Tax=Peronospora matthiolae TaxID=2874970 RepID=A0AAV1UYL0_9STRA
MGACSLMALLSHQTCLVVMFDETLNVNYQLGVRPPAVLRRRIAAPVNKKARSLPLHVTVFQDALQVKALITVQNQQQLWWGQEDRL